MRFGGCVFPYYQDQGRLVDEVDICPPGNMIVRGRPFFVGVILETQILEADAKELSSNIPLGREESSKAPTLLPSSCSHDETCIHHIP